MDTTEKQETKEQRDERIQREYADLKLNQASKMLLEQLEKIDKGEIRRNESYQDSQIAIKRIQQADIKFMNFMSFFYTLVDSLDNVPELSNKLIEYYENNELEIEDLKAIKSVMTGIIYEITYSRPEKREFFPEFIENLEKNNLVEVLRNQNKQFNKYIMDKLQNIS